MKKILLLGILVISILTIHAQITVNAIDLNIGDKVYQSVDSNFQTPLFGPGADLFWDFSGIHGYRIDTIAPIDPTTTTHSSSFPSSNLAFGTTDLATYYNLGSNAFVNLGFGGYVAQLGQEVEIINQSLDNVISFPINYGDNNFSNSWGESNQLTVSTYTGLISHSVKRTQVCDAWGQVATPLDTYDVLRVQEETITIDSVFAIMFSFKIYVDSLSQFDTTYSYNFYTNDPTIKYPLLEVTYDHLADTILETKWVTFMPDYLNQISKTDLSIYPNPSSDFIHIEVEESLIDVKIYNGSGQVCKTSQHKTVSISDLPPSIYFIDVETKTGHYKTKFIKN